MILNSYELNYNELGLNIVSKKAFDGDEKAIELLLNGAPEDVVNDAVYGFAYGGHVELVNRFIKASPNSILAAGQGYARASNKAQVASLVLSEPLKISLILGGAEAGNEKLIRGVLKDPNGLEYLPIIIQGLASSGHSKLVLELLANTKYYPIGLRAAATSGNSELINELLSALGINLEDLTSSKTPISAGDKRTLAYVLEGYAEGRHFEEAISIIELGVNPMHGLNKLAAKGTIDNDDAQMLLSAASKQETHTRLAALLTEQFDLEPEKFADRMDTSISLIALDSKLQELVKKHKEQQQPKI